MSYLASRKDFKIKFEERDGKCVLTSNFISWQGWKSTSSASRLMFRKGLSPIGVNAESLDTQILKKEPFDPEGGSRFSVLGEAIKDHARRISEWMDELEEERRTSTTNGGPDGREALLYVLSKYSLLLSAKTIDSVITAVHALHRHDPVDKLVGSVRTNVSSTRDRDWLDSTESRFAGARISRLQQFTAERSSLHCNAFAEVSDNILLLCDQAVRYPAASSSGSTDAAAAKSFRDHAEALSMGLRAIVNRMNTRSEEFDQLNNDITTWLTKQSASPKTLKKLGIIRQQSYDSLKYDLECLDARFRDPSKMSKSQQGGGVKTPTEQSSKKRNKRRNKNRSSQSARSDLGGKEEHEGDGEVGDDSLAVPAKSGIKTDWLPTPDEDNRREGLWTEIKRKDPHVSSDTELATNEGSIALHAYEFRQLVIGSDTKFTRPDVLPDPDFGTTSLLRGSAAVPQLVIRGVSQGAPLTEDQEAAREKGREDRISADEQWLDLWNRSLVLKPTESELLPEASWKLHETQAEETVHGGSELENGSELASPIGLATTESDADNPVDSRLGAKDYLGHNTPRVTFGWVFPMTEGRQHWNVQMSMC